MVHVDKVNFKGDPNIGLYCVATDKYALLGGELSKSKLKLLEEVTVAISLFLFDITRVQ